jgi:hypothetical protein
LIGGSAQQRPLIQSHTWSTIEDKAEAYNESNPEDKIVFVDQQILLVLINGTL